MKKYKFDADAKESLLKGIKVLSDVVGATLGPQGNNVAIDMTFGHPIVIHDGVTAARAVELSDLFENVGVKIAKQSAIKTNEEVGDGTTTATILAHGMIAEGMKKIEGGVNSMDLRRQLTAEIEKVIQYLKEHAKKIVSPDEVLNIATISAQDSEIGKAVADAIQKVGEDGVVSVEEGTGRNVTVEYKEGMQVDKGYITPYFITDQVKARAEISDACVLVTNHDIADVHEILPLIEVLETKNVFVIANSLTDTALNFFVTNRVAGRLNPLVIEAPAFSARRNDILQDIACLVGGVFIDRTARKLSSVTLADLGYCAKVIASQDATMIIGGKGDVKERISQIKESMKVADGAYEKDILSKRLARLSSGAAVISIGGTTEIEMREKKERAIDAVAATRAALSEGIIPGGGTLLVKYARSYTPTTAGGEVIKTALVKPFMRLVTNAGLDYLECVKQLDTAKEDYGIDVTDGKTKNLLKAGIVDPVKVTRTALESALSVAGSVLTTSVLIVEEPKDEKK